MWEILGCLWMLLQAIIVLVFVGFFLGVGICIASFLLLSIEVK
jgi:hypothetical protein